MIDRNELKKLALDAKRFEEEVRDPAIVLDLLEAVDSMPPQEEVDKLLDDIRGRITGSNNRVPTFSEVFEQLCLLVGSERFNDGAFPSRLEDTSRIYARPCPDCKAPAEQPCNGDELCQARIDQAHGATE